VRDFAPVSLLVINPQILVVNNSVPVGSVKELIAYAKSRPGQLNYASVGQGSPNHLGMELLKALTGIDMVHVPYKGTGPAVTDLLGGQVQLMFNSMPLVLPLVKGGKLKGLAVGSAQRSPAVPDLPTVAEAGVPGFENVTWYGMFAPARTHKDVVAKLNAQVVKILADPEMAQRMASQGAEPRSTTPEELARFMRVESERWKKVIKTANIKLE
jgi:tripartite-type tricarboxylate transporter receptor subunit TctC